MPRTLPLFALLIMISGVAHGQSAASPEEMQKYIAKGEKVFRKCKACHTVGENAVSKIGPALNGIIGREIAQNDDFQYSKAFLEAKDKGMVWSKEELGSYLKKPKKHIPGTAMNFVGLSKEKDRASVIAYLETFSTDGKSKK